MYTKRRLVYAVGVNDSTEVCENNPIYSRWVGMLKRCYSEKYLKLNPNYMGCTVCDEWLTFSNFKAWMESQEWEGKELDKDLLGDGKIYSPDTCCFVTKNINYFLVHRKTSSNCLIGCDLIPSGMYQSRCRNPLTEVRDYLGTFKTELEAHKVWQAKKHEYSCMLADMQSEELVAKALRERYAPDKDWTIR